MYDKLYMTKVSEQNDFLLIVTVKVWSTDKSSGVKYMTKTKKNSFVYSIILSLSIFHYETPQQTPHQSWSCH